MLKKIVLSCAATMILGSGLSVTAFASDVNAVPPIHWSSHPFDNSAGAFESGKAFCAKKFIGRKTCIPAMNNTSDILTFSADTYGNSDAQVGNVVTLMGKGSLPSTIFTVQDTAPDGTKNTVYSGPANNRVGIICKSDPTTKNVTCSDWK